MTCPRCQNEIRIDFQHYLAYLVRTIQLRANDLGTEVLCPHCGRAYIYRNPNALAHRPVAPLLGTVDPLTASAAEPSLLLAEFTAADLRAARAEPESLFRFR